MWVGEGRSNGENKRHTAMPNPREGHSLPALMSQPRSTILRVTNAKVHRPHLSLAVHTSQTPEHTVSVLLTCGAPFLRGERRGSCSSHAPVRQHV